MTSSPTLTHTGCECGWCDNVSAHTYSAALESKNFLLGSSDCRVLTKKRANVVPVHKGCEGLREDVGSMVLGAKIRQSHDRLVDLLHHKVNFLQTMLHPLAVTTEVGRESNHRRIVLIQSCGL